MSDFNPREPIRLSDIDNLLEDSIFTSSNGAKLAEYLRKKRGTAGRVRLQNIFEQVAANIPKPIFNFDIDNSDPNPLPDSPPESDSAEPEGSAPTAGTSGPVQNGNAVAEVAAAAANEPILTPLVVLHDYKRASPKSTTKAADQGVSTLGRQALLNQYHRTNMAKCELLRQITSSTPKPEASSSLSRISAFTTSISPITEMGSAEVLESNGHEVGPPLVIPMSEPVAVPAVPYEPVAILAPCTQAPTEITPWKNITTSTAAAVAPQPPDMIIPETPSPVKEVVESPRVAHQIQPRKLSDTFNNLKEQQANESDQNITSDESQSVEEENLVEDLLIEEEQSLEEGQLMQQSYSEQTDEEEEGGRSLGKQRPVNVEASEHLVTSALQVQSTENSFITKSILKDSYSVRKRHSFRVSFSQHLVQQREISPAPSIPEAHYSSASEDSSDLSDEDNFEDAEFEVIDEVYSDDGDCDPQDIEENYKELAQEDELENRMTEIHDRIPSPLINVDDEAPVQWYETRTPRNHQEHKNQCLAPATCAKDNKTDLQLVDIITDWDDEEDDDDAAKENQEQPTVEHSQPAPIEIPETQQSANVTVCNPTDITNMEDSAERLVELPPPPASPSGAEDANSDIPVTHPITPPSQFNDSAKRRFLRENEDALIIRLQNDLPPPSQPVISTPDTPERVSETLMDIVQSFRDQIPPPVVTAASRKTIVPTRKVRRRTSVVDPATNPYFESVMMPFAPATAKGKKSEKFNMTQKRKLYVASNEETNGVQLGGVVESPSSVRNFKVIVEKLKVDNYAEKLTASDRAAIENANYKNQNEQTTQPISPKAANIDKKKNNPDKTAQQELLVPRQPYVSDLQLYNTESSFAGFDEQKDLGPAPQTKLLRIVLGNDALYYENNTEAVPKGTRRILRKKKTKHPEECSNPAGETEDDLPNERLISGELMKAPAVGTRKYGSKKKKQIPVEKIAEPTVEDRAEAEGELSNERLNADESQSSAGIGNKNNGRRCKSVRIVSSSDETPNSDVTEGKARTTRLRKITTTDERVNSSTKVLDEPPPVSIVKNLVPAAVEDRRVVNVSEVPGTESVDPNKEKERMITRTRLDGQKKRGRPKGKKRAVVNESNPKNNNIEAEESAPLHTPVTDTTQATSSTVEAHTQSLPFKKRKDRMISTDDPPTLEPFGGATPADSNGNIPPLLEANDPIPGTSKQTRHRNPRYHHEKHTTEKPEKYVSKYYRDASDEVDETWVPGKKCLKDSYNRKLRKHAANPPTTREAEPEPEPIEQLRRSKRTRRLAEHIVRRNPDVKSIYEKPIYRQVSDKEFVEITRKARQLAAEKKQLRKDKLKPGTSNDVDVAAPDSRKRLHEDQQDPVASKRNRPEDAIVLLTDLNPNKSASPPAPRDSDKNMSTEKMRAHSWMLKLMQTNGVQSAGVENAGLIVGGNYVHCKQEHLSCRERNGIQYSFYLHSETENYGFMRFSPSAIKKLTKTERFLLKFLILEGHLSFQLNGQQFQVKSGDFLMLPENSAYAIENGPEISLIFMIKLCSSMVEA